MKLSKIISAIMIVILLCTVFTICMPDALAYDYFGMCGESVTYFHLANSTLYISGTGEMYDYSESNPAPWHENASSIIRVYITDGVTGIGDYAFADCKNLSTISDATSITSVGSHAFSGCNSLSAIPSGITSVGDYAFEDCTRLTSANVYGSKLGVGAFSGCTSLQKVSFNDKFSSIPKRAFFGCSSLTSIAFPDNLTTIETSAFQGCSSLGTVIFPSGVTSIGVDAFKNCSSLTGFTIPEGITSLEEGVLAGCSALESIVIHEGMTGLGKNAFANCSSLLRVILPNTLTTLGEGVFSGCSTLLSISFSDGITEIPDKAFSACTSLAYIELPLNVKYIGTEAFSGCTGLNEISINEGLTEIRSNAFSNCISLKSCTLPSSISTIGDSVFSGCTALKSVKFIGYLSNWEKVTVGDDNELLSTENIVTEYLDGDNLGGGIYWSVSNDGCLIISGNGKMPDFELNNTPWIKYKELITSIAVDSNIEYVGANAFASLIKITEVQLPDGITKISDGMFRDCTALESIAELENITHIGNSAFEGCVSLLIDNTYGLTLGDRAFAGCISFEKMVIAGALIGDEAFADCTNLKSIIIKNTVTEIGTKAFADCPLVIANFTGTSDELQALVIGEDNQELKNVMDIYYYIRNLYVGHGINKREAVASIKDKSDGILNIDLNKSVEDYYCLGYSLTSDPEEALTGVALYSTNGATSDGSIDFNGNTYYLISTPIVTDESGVCTYVCTTKEVSAGEPLFMVGLLNNDSGRKTFKLSESWLVTPKVNDDTATFDGRTDGISLYYTKDIKTDISSPFNYEAVIIVLVCFGIIGIGIGVYFCLKKNGKLPELGLEQKLRVFSKQNNEKQTKKPKVKKEKVNKDKQIKNNKTVKRKNDKASTKVKNQKKK